jgi:hypothetical protein
MGVLQEMVLKKAPTKREIEVADHSMSALNAALKTKFEKLKSPKLLLWAGDFHLHQNEAYDKEIDIKYEKIDCSRQFELCLEEIKALEIDPSVLMLGGDITDNSFPGEWKEFKRVLEKTDFRIPTIPIFGNHEHAYFMDDGVMKRVWSDLDMSGWPEIENPNEFFFSVVLDDLKLIILDTVKIIGEVMSETQKSFLIKELTGSDKPVLIFQHKHIMPALNWLDDGLYKDKGMVDIIIHSPNVLGVFSGHTHKQSLWHYMGKVYGSFPAVSYGIGDKTGWGGIILDGSEISEIFIKDLTGETYDDCTGSQLQEGSFRFLNAESFERSPLLDPEFWYRNPEPEMRK